MKWLVDKMACCQVDEMTSFWDFKLTKWQVDGVTCSKNGKLLEFQVDKMASRLNDKLTKWQVVGIPS